EAAELGGSADGIEMTSEWTAMDPTNAKRRARTPISNAAQCRLGDRSGDPDDNGASRRAQCVVGVRMGKFIASAACNDPCGGRMGDAERGVIQRRCQSDQAEARNLARRTESSNPASSSRESRLCRNSRCQVEKPGFAAGVRATASGAVGRDAQGTAKSGQSSIISLSAQNPVPERR